MAALLELSTNSVQEELNYAIDDRRFYVRRRKNVGKFRRPRLTQPVTIPACLSQWVSHGWTATMAMEEAGGAVFSAAYWYGSDCGFQLATSSTERT